MTDVLKCDGFNLVQNNHEVAGQTVFHFHMHLIPRYLNAKNNDILNWSHETFSPEEMAEIRDSLKMDHKPKRLLHDTKIVVPRNSLTTLLKIDHSSSF